MCVELRCRLTRSLRFGMLSADALNWAIAIFEIDAPLYIAYLK